MYSIFEKRASKPANGAGEAVIAAKPRKARKATPAEDVEASEKSLRSAAPPKKAKETHPFFAKPAKVEQAKGTQEDAVVVPDSPKRSEHAFERQETSFAEGERLRRQRMHEYRGYAAAWPTAKDHHVNSVPYTSYRANLPFSRKGKEREVEPLPIYAPFQTLPSPASTSADVSRSFEALTEAEIERRLPKSYEAYPLLSRVAELATDEAWRSDEGSELWTTKYAPACTAEVLGETSGKSAASLVKWLRELAIKGRTDDSRKKQIRRQVAPKKKQKKTSEFDDFLAGSDEEASPLFFRSPTASPAKHGSAPTTPRTPRSDSRAGAAPAFAELTNLMLLKGPPGSGKTASVYAAAKELDWEVFELSSNEPRSGKALEQMFGGMTTNEHLHKGRQAAPGGTSPRQKNFFAPRHDKKRKAIVLDSDDTEHSAAQPTISSMRQSVILLEEVDVLFPDDKGFWESLVQLVAKSRRPVIMTCNDASILPLHLFALQDTLVFEPPEPELAKAFLQLVALAEGHLVGEGQTAQLYSVRDDRERRVPPSSIDDRPLPPVPKHRAAPSRDLRRALLQLQVYCQASRPDDDPFVDWTKRTVPMEEDETEDQKGDRMVEALDFATTRSAVDALVERRAAMYLEDYDAAKIPDDDIEMGPMVLSLQPDRFRFSILPDLAREPEMAATLFDMALNRSEVALEMAWPDKSDATFEADRRLFCQRAETATTILPLTAPLLPSPAVTSDYIPFLRAIIVADDLHEAGFDPSEPATMAPGQARRAMTRSSSRRYARHLELIEYDGELSIEALAVLREFGYRGER